MGMIEALLAEHCPDGVEHLPLQVLFNIKGGYTPSKTDATAWQDGTVPWFRVDDIRTHGRVLSDSIQHVNESAVKGGRLFPANSLLISTSATIGEHALVTVPHLSNQRFVSLSLRTDYCLSVDMNYMYYYGFILADWCRKNTTTSSFATVQMDAFRNYLVPVPPLPVQRAIAEALSAMETLETSLSDEEEARRQQFDYYRDALIASATPQVVTTIGGLGSVFGGLTGKSKVDFADGDTQFLTYMDVFTSSTAPRAASGTVTLKPKEKQRRLHLGDVLFTGSSERASEVGMSSVLRHEPSEPLYLNSFCFALRPADGISLTPEFATHLFRSRSMRSQIVKCANGVTRFNMSKDAFKKISLDLPSLEDQVEFAARLDAMQALIQSIAAEREARREQFEHYRDRFLTFPERIVAS